MVKECNGDVKNVLELIFYKFSASSAMPRLSQWTAMHWKHNSQDISC